MTTVPAISPREADEFILRELDSRLRKVEAAFDADGIGFISPLWQPIDDHVRNLIETLAHQRPRNRRLVFILTTRGGSVEVVQRIVETIRHFYTHVVFVVPNYAFSAGTILAM